MVTFVQSLLDSKLDSKARPGKIAFGMEAGLYWQRCGISTIVCGPGDISNAHQADEYVDARQLATCDLLLGRLAAALSR